MYTILYTFYRQRTVDHRTIPRFRGPSCFSRKNRKTCSWLFFFHIFTASYRGTLYYITGVSATYIPVEVVSRLRSSDVLFFQLICFRFLLLCARDGPRDY